jgi:hypothetical protein
LVEDTGKNYDEKGKEPTEPFEFLVSCGQHRDSIII